MPWGTRLRWSHQIAQNFLCWAHQPIVVGVIPMSRWDKVIGVLVSLVPICPSLPSTSPPALTLDIPIQSISPLYCSFK